MLDTASWLPQAEGLEVGRKRYAEHSCGGGRKLLISRDTNGYSAWCFRCSESGWAPAPKLSLAERIAATRKLAASDADVQRAGNAAPEPRVYDVAEWPTEAALWLYKAGLGRNEIARLGAYYHPPTNRVVVPVLEAGKTTFWQARSVDGRLPKYLSPPIDRATVLPRYGSGDTITLTEDLLSAFKIGLVSEAWCLMGTAASDRVVAGLLGRNVPVRLWLDPDRAGVRGRKKLLLTLKARGLDVSLVRSARDPKLHSLPQIKDLLS